jgi:hypothetical protein
MNWFHNVQVSVKQAPVTVNHNRPATSVGGKLEYPPKQLWSSAFVHCPLLRCAETAADTEKPCSPWLGRLSSRRQKLTKKSALGMTDSLPTSMSLSGHKRHSDGEDHASGERQDAHKGVFPV